MGWLDFFLSHVRCRHGLTNSALTGFEQILEPALVLVSVTLQEQQAQFRQLAVGILRGRHLQFAEEIEEFAQTCDLGRRVVHDDERAYGRPPLPERRCVNEGLEAFRIQHPGLPTIPQSRLDELAGQPRLADPPFTPQEAPTEPAWRMSEVPELLELLLAVFERDELPIRVQKQARLIVGGAGPAEIDTQGKMRAQPADAHARGGRHVLRQRRTRPDRSVRPALPLQIHEAPQRIGDQIQARVDAPG